MNFKISEAGKTTSIKPTTIGGGLKASLSSIFKTRHWHALPLNILALVFFVFLAMPTANAQKLDYSVNYSNTAGVFSGCTEVCIDFIVINTDDKPVGNVSLGLFVNSVYAEVTDSGDFDITTLDSAFYCAGCSPPTNNVADFYSITGLTIQPDSTTFRLCFELPGGVPNSPLFHYVFCESGTCFEIMEMAVLNPQQATVLVKVGETVELTDLIDPMTLLPLGPNSTAKDVIVRGTLIIDTDYEFTGNNFMLGHPNAKVIVEGLSTLTFTNEHVFGCKDAWQGIEALDDAEVVMRGTVFEDAIVGVKALNGSKLDINGTEFKNNGTGIWAYGPSNISNLLVTENSFDVIALKSPIPGGFAGLRLSNFDLGLVGRNTYKNMDYGIYGVGSSLFTFFDSFSDLVYAGIAMQGSGRTLVQNGLGNGVTTFTNMNTAVRTLGMNVEVAQNGMTRVAHGLRAYSLNNREVQVHDNTIRATTNGVLLSGLQPITHSSVNDNTILMDGNASAGRGINSISTRSSDAGKVSFENNIINVYDGAYAVDMLNNWGVEAYSNNINLNNPVNCFGFSVDGGNTNDLNGNTVNAAGLLNLQYGIAVQQSNSGIYGCNNFNGVRTGMWFDGANSGSDITGNNFNGFFHGLRVGSEPNFGGFTGKQVHRGNMWLSAPAATGFGAIHYTLLPDELTNSQHEVNPSPASLSSTQKTFIQGQNFFLQLPGNTSSCSSAIAGPSGTDNADSGIADGSFVPGYFAAEAWTAKRQLYRRLLNAPLLAPNGSVFVSFLNANASTTVGQFEYLQQNIDDMLMGNDADRAELASKKDELLDKMDDLLAVSELLIAQPTDNGLLVQQASLRTATNALAVQMATKEAAMQTARSSAASSLLASNAAISTTYSYEANQRTANRILLETIINDQYELTPQQVADLTPIAVQCPLEGGEGVYMARALLGNEVVYDDENACTLAAQPIEGQRAMKSDLPQIKMYPNPASGYTVVALDKPLNEDAVLTFANTFGVVVLTEKILEGVEAVPVDTDSFPSGTYFLSLKSSAGNQTSILSITK